MSYQQAPEPRCEAASGSVDLLVTPRERDLGEFTVRRVLPSGKQRMVGPFIFFDHMGPATFAAGEGIQVRPHPHIGIATITYLFEGEILHRDGLGYTQPIEAGAVNLMTAGSGIVHSERAGSDLDRESRLHGIQSWMALPDGQEEIDAAFAHTPAEEIPELELDGVTIRVIMGELAGMRSPVTTYSPTLYAELRLSPDATFEMPATGLQLGYYVVEGEASIGAIEVSAGAMAIVNDGCAMRLKAATDTRIMVAGGAPVGERHIWWNFVSSSRERIDAAKRLWSDGGFVRIDGDDEFIPLPD